MPELKLFRCPSCGVILSEIYRGKGDNCQECDWNTEADAQSVTIEALPVNEQAFALREQGWEVRDIAAKFEVSTRTVIRWTAQVGERKQSQKLPRKETLLDSQEVTHER